VGENFEGMRTVPKKKTRLLPRRLATVLCGGISRKGCNRKKRKDGGRKILSKEASNHDTDSGANADTSAGNGHEPCLRGQLGPHHGRVDQDTALGRKGTRGAKEGKSGGRSLASGEKRNLTSKPDD